MAWASLAVGAISSVSQHGQRAALTLELGSGKGGHIFAYDGLVMWVTRSRMLEAFFSGYLVYS